MKRRKSSEGQELPWRTFKAAMTDRYGAPLFRVPLDGGGTCPNRNEDRTGGCSFCAEDGGRAVQTGKAGTLDQQCGAGMDFARRRYGASRFMAYLQTFTNTLDEGPLADGSLHELLHRHAFTAVTIGTRPDCITADAIRRLQALAAERDVYVELGVQSTNDRVLQEINRGHDWACSQRAIEQLHAAGLNPVAHMILGLPGESWESMLEGAKQMAERPLAGIKLHNLHVIRDTQMAQTYATQPFPLLDPYAYAELVLQYLCLLPPELPIQRLTTDTPKDRLVAPHWAMEKGQFTTMLARLMQLRGASQGVNGPTRPPLHPQPLSAEAADGYQIRSGQDGSPTAFVAAAGTYTHPPTGSVQTAREAFVEPACFANRLTTAAHPHRLLDIGFGMGTNTLCACEEAQAIGRPLDVTAIDHDLRLLLAGTQHLSTPPGGQLNWKEILSALLQDRIYHTDAITIRYINADVRYALPTLYAVPFDTVFYDPFPLPYDPQLWNEDAARLVGRALKSDGVLVARKPSPAFRETFGAQLAQ